VRRPGDVPKHMHGLCSAGQYQATVMLYLQQRNYSSTQYIAKVVPGIFSNIYAAGLEQCNRAAPDRKRLRAVFRHANIVAVSALTCTRY
jgi:hypothetical protein